MEFIEAWSADEGAQRVAEGFKKTFGTEPAGVWQAPGRVNIIGEHTDYNQGLCAPIALPHRTYVAVSPEPEADVVRLASAQAPGVWEIAMNEVVPGKVKGWGAYVAGTVWGMRGLGLEAPGITGYVDSCVPFGAGLSSSAALSCSFAVALEDLSREAGDITCTTDVRKQLVKAAMAAENQIVGAPTGGLDQSASLLAEQDHVLIIDFLDFSTHQVPFDLKAAGLELLVIDTRAKHELSDGQYGSRRAQSEAAAKKLGIPSLRYADDLAAAMKILGPDTVEGKRARHVITEIARVRDFEAALKAGDWAAMGPLFAASHASLRYDYEVTVPELDVAVEAALANGATAARMTGGGFGGSVIALIPTGEAAKIADGVDKEFAKNGFGAPAFLTAFASGPAGAVD
ncbi:MAG: galactokinase [Propionibacteriaceae bacterium]|jgi:galactokinase|nr:galactokinase [Propionibacteriaceae bacterium]